MTDSILLKPQAGPRHILFNRSKGHLYVLNELNNSIEFFENMTSDTVFNRIQSVNLISFKLSILKMGRQGLPLPGILMVRLY